jgi:Ni,Fe-hydrogenase III small subunit
MPWRQLLVALRQGPTARPVPPPDAETVRALALRLEAASQRRLGRSLAIRAVNAGGCNGCELELRMLASIVYDLERFGVSFVASPRHADVLLATGPVTRNMHEPLARTWQAMPDPKWVIAVGDCAIDAGVFKGSYAISGGADVAVPVDMLVRGCPPTPTQMLDALRTLLETNTGPIDSRGSARSA